METLDQKIVRYTATTSAALEKAAAIEANDRNQREKTAAAIPGAADAVIATGMVSEQDRDRLVARLAEPTFALDLLRKTAAQLQSSQSKTASAVPSVGEPTRTNLFKTAADGSEAFHGGMRSNAVRESDVAFLRGLGLSN